MTDIIHFTPRVDHNAQENLNAFVAVCKYKLTTFGADLPFDEDSWNVTNYINIKANRCAVNIVFSSWVSENYKTSKPMTEGGFNRSMQHIR